jgi:hypothetical protein
VAGADDGRVVKRPKNAPDRPTNDIRTYRDLLVWQRAMDLAEAVYRATELLRYCVTWLCGETSWLSTKARS